MHPTPKPMRPAAFAAHVVTNSLAAALSADALTSFLTAGILWRGLLAELQVYADAEAVALAGLHPDTEMAARLSAAALAGLTPALRKELRGRIKAEAEGRGRATAALLRLLKCQIAACENAGPAFREAEAVRLAEYLLPTTYAVPA